MKKAIIIIVIVFVLTGVFVGTKKILGATKLDFDIGDIDLPIHSFDGMIDFMDGGAYANIEVIIMNYSNERYKIDNVNIYLKNLDQTVNLAYQTKPLDVPIVIEPNSNTSVIIPMYFKTAMIFQLLKQLGIAATNLTAAWDVIQSYFTTGKLGTSIVVDGYASLSIFKPKFNFEKQI